MLGERESAISAAASPAASGDWRTATASRSAAATTSSTGDARSSTRCDRGPRDGASCTPATSAPGTTRWCTTASRLRPDARVCRGATNSSEEGHRQRMSRAFKAWSRGPSSGRGSLDLMVQGPRGEPDPRTSPTTPWTPVRAGGRSRKRRSVPCPYRSSPASLFARFASPSTRLTDDAGGGGAAWPVRRSPGRDDRRREALREWRLDRRVRRRSRPANRPACRGGAAARGREAADARSRRRARQHELNAIRCWTGRSPSGTSLDQRREPAVCVRHVGWSTSAIIRAPKSTWGRTFTMVGPNGQGRTDLSSGRSAISRRSKAIASPRMPPGALGGLADGRAWSRRAWRAGDPRRAGDPAPAGPAGPAGALTPIPAARGARRHAVGVLRAGDLALVKAARLLQAPVSRRPPRPSANPRWSAVRADYERILKQRNALLKSGRPCCAKFGSEWWIREARAGAAYTRRGRQRRRRQRSSAVCARDARICHTAHGTVGIGAGGAGGLCARRWRRGWRALPPRAVPASSARRPSSTSLAAVQDNRSGRASPSSVRMVTSSARSGRWRAPARPRGSWSVAHGLRAGAYHLLRHDLDGSTSAPYRRCSPVELSIPNRRERLAGIVADCAKQVLNRAADGEPDIPASLARTRHLV